MTETLTNILQWLIPSGSLGAVVVWLTNKTLRNLRTAKEVHDTYKKMYEDLRITLVEIQTENKKLYRILSRFERAFSKACTCRYYPNCPVSAELLQHDETSKPKGQYRQRAAKIGDAGEGEGAPDESGDTPEQ